MFDEDVPSAIAGRSLVGEHVTVMVYVDALPRLQVEKEASH
jgi:hypothetical protein